MVDNIVLECSDNNIHVKNIENCDADSVICITVPSDDLSSVVIENTYIYKVQKNGEIIFTTSNGETTNKLSPKGLLDMFEEIPDNLSDYDVKKIVAFLNEKSIIETGRSRIYPYSVNRTDNGDIGITFIIYNGDTISLGLPKLPIKLTDANKSVVFAEMVELNASVNHGKIGIVQAVVPKEKLKKEFPNLDQWDILFEM